MQKPSKVVSILQVGIGGEYDATNFFLQPTVCGVASLGYDHITILGETLDQIAWHKAGIFKVGYLSGGGGGGGGASR